jgi:hypothetical protein
MANQTITQYHHFFKERRDLRERRLEFLTFLRGQHPHNHAQTIELMRLSMLVAGQLLFWAISLLEDEQRQNNPFVQARRTPQ